MSHSLRVRHHVPQTVARDDEPAVVRRQLHFMKEGLGRDGVFEHVVTEGSCDCKHAADAAVQNKAAAALDTHLFSPVCALVIVGQPQCAAGAAKNGAGVAWGSVTHGTVARQPHSSAPALAVYITLPRASLRTRQVTAVEPVANMSCGPRREGEEA